MSYRNTHESLGELEEAVETLTCGSCSHSNLSFSQTFTCVSIARYTVHVFYLKKT